MKNIFLLVSLNLLLVSCTHQPARMITPERSTANTGLFFESDFKELALITDFEKVFSQAESENPEKVTGIFRYQINEKIWQIPVEVSVRGNTSRYDCKFKKLALDFKKSLAVGTPLEGLTKLRLNTHCDEKDGYTEMGRVTGKRGPLRESVVYDLQKAMDLPSFLKKSAQINYYQTGQEKLLTKQSVLFLESKKNMSQRLNAEIQEEEDVADQEVAVDELQQKHRARQTLKALLFNVMIGNNDFSLQLKDLNGQRHYNMIAPPPSGLWNMLLIKYASGEIAVSPTDFDVANAVRQTAFMSFPSTKTVSQCTQPICESQFADLQKWRAFFSAADFAHVQQEFEQRKDNMLRLIQNSSELNAQEKAFLQAQIQSFLVTLKSHLRTPVLLTATPLYYDKDLKNACGQESPTDKYVIKTVPGMPVKIIETQGNAVKIWLLDTRDRSLNHPDTSQNCADNPMWIPRQSVITSEWP